MLQWEWVYCEVDDFRQGFLPVWERQLLEAGVRQRQRPAALTVSEVMTIVAGLIAYTYQPKKPSLNLRSSELDRFPVLV